MEIGRVRRGNAPRAEIKDWNLDIYRCVKWLIEDEFTTGQIISINGGYVI